MKTKERKLKRDVIASTLVITPCSDHTLVWPYRRHGQVTVLGTTYLNPWAFSDLDTLWLLSLITHRLPETGPRVYTIIPVIDLLCRILHWLLVAWCQKQQTWIESYVVAILTCQPRVRCPPVGVRARPDTSPAKSLLECTRSLVPGGRGTAQIVPVLTSSFRTDNRNFVRKWGTHAPHDQKSWHCELC